MNEEQSQTLLRFTGDWPALPVLGVASLLALLMFFFYRRELRHHEGAARWVLPLLRSLAVFLLVMCLAGPVLRNVKTFRQLGRVVIAVDASASMSFNDIDSAKPRGGAPRTESRFTRAEHALLSPTDSLVRKLALRHDVELIALRGSNAERIWWRREGGADTSGELPVQFGFKPDATITNLDAPLREAMGTSPSGSALVLLSDGQHNASGSPEELATSLHDAGVPVFSVGYGSEVPPPDLGLLNVLAPEAVFAGDRAEGLIVMNDTLPKGLHALASIRYENKVLWQQPFTTDGGGERRLEFSFPVSGIADTGDVKQTLRLLNIKLELTGDDIGKDRITENKSRTLALHLLTRKRRALILDGRPRWETRYLKNHFDRDQRWQVVAAFDVGITSAAGTIQKAFPKRKEDLLTYDLVVLGDLRADALTADQQAMLAEFVEKRGGGLILIDGQRHHLAGWAKTKAAPLLPVSWNDKPAPDKPMSYALTNDGKNTPALRLSDSATANVTLWAKLPRANWCANATPLADATTLVTLNDGKTKLPALVWRRFGAGDILWLGTDEFWRWRYEVADQHHQRFWMQVASWIAAPPFLVENDRISLGTDRLRYHEGDSAEVRVRLRDKNGGIVTDAKPRAHVLRNGLEVASLELEPDPSHGGVFRAVTGTLPAGDYHITVSEGSSPANDVRLAFRVESHANQEWAQLNMNRPLLESMARSSGGRFLREGDISQLPDLLQTLDRQETRIKETLLWSSWWWFGAVIVLLTAEWLLRKKWRLV